MSSLKLIAQSIQVRNFRSNCNYQANSQIHFLDTIDESAKEIRLFSLKLQPTYELFGSEYRCIGTVNYNVENEDGGHYVTYLFPSINECLRIHETDATIQWKRPDFDNETVIVALQRSASCDFNKTL